MGAPAVVEFWRSRLDLRAEFEALTPEVGSPQSRRYDMFGGRGRVRMVGMGAEVE